MMVSFSPVRFLIIMSICGAVGYISVKTTALAEDSAVSRMVRLVEEAQNQHSRMEQLVERVAKFYTPRKLNNIIFSWFSSLDAGYKL
jgi:cation transport ATPase